MRLLPTISIIVLLGVGILAAHAQVPLNGGSLEPPTDGPCLTPEQRAEIWANIKLNRERLRAEGLLAPPQKSIVLFDWPLLASPENTAFGIHGISNFVDQDPDYPDQLLDYNCGDRTYDLDSGYNHQGIDYYSAPFSWYMMDNNMAWIVAAAPGTIIFKQDGNYDRNCGFGSGDWNAVYVEHADGSVSWYGHMKEGSLTPKKVGDQVATGEFLGVIGSSGNSTGPHLHFETYDADDNLIEPYAGPCNMMNDDSWWLDQRPYYDSTINALKTHDAIPEFPDCPQQEIPHERNTFLPGEQMYFVVYYRDEVPDESTDFSVLRPDLTEQWSWIHDSTDYYSTSYWYWDRTLPGDAPEGVWTFRAEYNGEIFDQYFTVCSGDGSAPVLTCPDDIVVECTYNGGTSAYDPALWPFLYGATVSDDCDPYPTIDHNAPDVFPFGETMVTFTATDDFGNQDQCVATVTVGDFTDPEITCPEDITVECSSGGGTPVDDPQLAAFFAAPTATDNCDPNPSIDHDAPPVFPLGDTVVTFTATDDSGNEGTCTATVTVEDTTPPELEVSLNRDVLWPPNHKLSAITAEVTVTDVCDPDASFELVDVTSDEPDNGQGDGDTENDIQGADLNTADVEFQLRSERMGNGDGRVYTILYRAFDLSGNSTDEALEVHVPHDQDGNALAGSGFNDAGTGFEPGADLYSIVIPAGPAMDAEGLLVDEAYVGNHVGALRPLEHRLLDRNGDGLTDLEVTYDVGATLDLLVESDGLPVGMHYRHEERGDYALPDIFGLDRATSRVGDAPTADAPAFRVMPNPFTASTTISYAVTGEGSVPVVIEIFNVAGQKVRQLVAAHQAPGVYSTVWDGRTDAGKPAPAGIYLQRSVIGKERRTQRLVLLQ